MSVAITLKSDFAAGVKKANVELLVEEQGRDVGAVQDILEIIGDGLMLIKGLLKLAVERPELLVERLQFPP